MKSLQQTILTDSSIPFEWEQVLRELKAKRRVVVGRHAGKRVIAKFFLQAAKSYDQAQVEVERQASLVKAGVLTPAILYSGADSLTGHHVVMYEFIEQTADSRLVWNSKDPYERQQFISKIIGILAKQHAAGLCQHDLHPNNFILSHDLCYALDPTSVQISSSPLTKAACLKSIGELCAQMSAPNNDDYRYALKSYCNFRHWSMSDEDEKTVKKWQQKYRKRREAKYLEKLFRQCTRVSCFSTFRQRQLCWREKYTASMKTMLNNIDEAIDEGTLLKDGNSNTVACVQLGSDAYVIKRYNIKNCLQRIKRIMGKNRAVRSWENAGRLFFHHVATPTPIALVEHKWGPFRSTVYFVSCFEKGVSLDKFLKDVTVTENEKQFVMREVKSLFLSLRRLKLSHRDMKANNFLVTKDSVMLTDLDSMRYHLCSYTFKKAFLHDKLRFLENWSDENEYLTLFTRMFKEIEQ